MNARLDRLRHVTDLYVAGKTLTLSDGSPLWVRVLNPFEQDKARNEAQVARARLALAIREVGTDEQAKARESFFEAGHEGAIDLLVESKVAERYSKIVDSLRYDPDWKDRLDIVARDTDDTAKPLEGIEKEALDKIAGDYLAELNTRVEEERDGYRAEYQDADEEMLWEAYRDLYIDRRAGAAAMAEHQLHQVLYGTYVCDAILENGTWRHEKCDHSIPLFESADEVRTLPEDLGFTILKGINEIDMSVVEAKNSVRQESSFDSSPLPSEPVESTPSIPSAIPPEPTGS